MQYKQKKNFTLKLTLVLGILFSANCAWAQLESFRLTDTNAIKDLGIIRNKYNGLSFTGYIQTQFQLADTVGVVNYNGGNFQPYSDNRFYLRRARIRADYERRNGEGYLKSYFVVQFDGTDRGVNARDMFGRIYENKYHNFVLTAGLFNRPFGTELQYSSALRESPERGRMSQILMTVERDFGSMISFAPQSQKNKWRFLNADLGVFNGQGLTAAGSGNSANSAIGEFDKYKDIIARVSLKKYPLNAKKTILFSVGLSHLNGGMRGGSVWRYKTIDSSGAQYFKGESNPSFVEGKSPRIYNGADFSLQFNRKRGNFELRAETIMGTQSSTFATSQTPGISPSKVVSNKSYPDSICVRQFSGAYFYALYRFFDKHQILIKYDWYDPNSQVKGTAIDAAKGFSKTDIRYNTLGIGYNYYMSESVKLLLYFENPVNEVTKLSGYNRDLKDKTYTVRLQFRF
jgi:hypothetical protein